MQTPEVWTCWPVLDQLNQSLWSGLSSGLMVSLPWEGQALLRWGCVHPAPTPGPPWTEAQLDSHNSLQIWAGIPEFESQAGP